MNAYLKEQIFSIFITYPFKDMEVFCLLKLKIVRMMKWRACYFMLHFLLFGLSCKNNKRNRLVWCGSVGWSVVRSRKVAGLILSQGTCLGCRFDPWSGCMGSPFPVHTGSNLSMLSGPSSVPKSNEKISGYNKIKKKVTKWNRASVKLTKGGCVHYTS